MSLAPMLPKPTDPTDSNGTGGGRWMVTIYNNEQNSIGEVVGVLMRATHCTREEAEIETWEAHHYGKAPVHFAERPECESAAWLISTIGVRAEVSPEWKD